MRPREAEAVGLRPLSIASPTETTQQPMTRETSHPYTAGEKMSHLIADHYQIIQVMSRFGIAVGFGDNCISTVCRQNKVDCPTFLAVVNYVLSGTISDGDICNVSVEALMQYLRQSHIYFLQYFLPEIRRKLLDGIEFSTSDVSFLIIKFFDEYLHEVRTHMEYEERTVFAHINRLLHGDAPADYRIDVYSDHPEQVGDKLHELKNLIIKYCPDSASTNLLNTALYDIYRCEEELDSHCRVENDILVPAIRLLEQKVTEGGVGQ